MTSASLQERPERIHNLSSYACPSRPAWGDPQTTRPRRQGKSLLHAPSSRVRAGFPVEIGQGRDVFMGAHFFSATCLAAPKPVFGAGALDKRPNTSQTQRERRGEEDKVNERKAREEAAKQREESMTQEKGNRQDWTHWMETSKVRQPIVLATWNCCSLWTATSKITEHSDLEEMVRVTDAKIVMLQEN
eukprot:9499769-Pyramimonas_sp.AAC.1